MGSSTGMFVSSRARKRAGPVQATQRRVARKSLCASTIGGATGQGVDNRHARAKADGTARSGIHTQIKEACKSRYNLHHSWVQPRVHSERPMPISQFGPPDWPRIPKYPIVLRVHPAGRDPSISHAARAGTQSGHTLDDGGSFPDIIPPPSQGLDWSTSELPRVFLKKGCPSPPPQPP